MFADTRALEWNETINVQMIMGQFTGSGIQCTGSLSFGAFQTGIIAMYERQERETGRGRARVVKWANSKQVNKIYYKLRAHTKKWCYEKKSLRSRQFNQGRWNEPLRQIEFNAMKINEINLKCWTPNRESDVVVHGSMRVRHLNTEHTHNQAHSAAADRHLEVFDVFQLVLICRTVGYPKQWHCDYRKQITQR